jgi:hypothetical protein
MNTFIKLLKPGHLGQVNLLGGVLLKKEKFFWRN